MKVETDKPGGTGMLILNLSGVSLSQLKIGDTQFGGYRSGAPIYVLGCSGPSSANISYDAPADHGVITVAASARDTRLVTVTADWNEDTNGEPLPTPEVATGIFTFRP